MSRMNFERSDNLKEVCPDSPIVVLDSGLGGLTVVRALQSALPHDDVIYFGDTARLPYGSKSASTVTEFVKQIITFLSPHRPKHVLIACNTATALALPALRGEFPGLSISGVIEPGARAAVAAAGAKERPCIGVLATEATVRSKAYERAIHRRRHHVRVLLRPTPLLVPIIEEGRDARDPLVTLAIEQYLEPLLARAIDVLLLGCTHYPMLKGLISKIAGPNVPVIDSASACAEDVHRRLSTAGLLRTTAGQGSLRCFVTDDSPRFGILASNFMGVPVEPPVWVPPADLYALNSSTALRAAV